MTKRKLSPMEEFIKDEIEPDVTGNNSMSGLLGILPLAVGITLGVYAVVEIVNGEAIQAELLRFGLGVLFTIIGSYLLFSKR